GEKRAGGGVVIRVAEWLGDLEIEATLDWQRTTPVKEECEASFLARLESSDEVVLTHGATACSALSEMQSGSRRYGRPRSARRGGGEAGARLDRRRPGRSARPRRPVAARARRRL